MIPKSKKVIHYYDLMGIVTIIKGHYGQLIAHTLYNIDKLEKFLENHKWPSVAQREIDNMNKHIY